MAPPLAIRVDMTPEKIARGKYIYTLADCDGCHSGRDWSRFAGPVVESQRGQGVEFPPELGLPGRIVSANITTDRETGIGSWTDGEKIRAIRDGIGRDGRALVPTMPYRRFRRMSDEDVYALVAYLNTLAPVRHNLPPARMAFPESVWVKSAPRPAGKVAAPDRANTLEYGKYLATIAGCRGCHTPPRSESSLRLMRFAGGRRFRMAGATVQSANITPDLHSGIGRWSETDYLDRMHQYRDYLLEGAPKVGPENFTVMPWLQVSQLREEDLLAIFHFLRAQKPVYHFVDLHPVDMANSYKR
jgi:hypothetical protein